MEVLENFGIQPILLIAQIVNFTILLLLLKKFLYKPIMKVLDERRQKIETSVKQAEEIEKKLTETEERQNQIIGEAESKSQKIIDDARQAAKKLQEATLVETSKKIEESLAKNKETIRLEREKMINEVKSDMAELIAETTKKVLSKSLTDKENEDLVKKSIKELEA